MTAALPRLLAAAAACPSQAAAVPLVDAIACLARAGPTALAVIIVSQQPVPRTLAALSLEERLVITIYNTGAGSMRTPPTVGRSSNTCSACGRRRRRSFLGLLVPVAVWARRAVGACGWCIAALVDLPSLDARGAWWPGLGRAWLAVLFLLLPCVLVILVVAAPPTRPAAVLWWRPRLLVLARGPMPSPVGLPRTSPGPPTCTCTVPLRDPHAAACVEEGRKESGMRMKGPTGGGRGGTVGGTW